MFMLFYIVLRGEYFSAVGFPHLCPEVRVCCFVFLLSAHEVLFGGNILK